MKGVPSSSSSGSTDKNLMKALLDEYMEPAPCKSGDVVEGIIASATDKAILVDIGAKCDAFVHAKEVEQMSARDLRALKSGQTVHVYIIGTAGDSDTILVSLARAEQYSDWLKARKLMENHKKVTLYVEEVNKGGVIVQLGRLRGFVPGSQLLPKWRPFQNTDNPERRWEALVGEDLTLQVIEVTPDRNRLILSERAAVDTKEQKRAILQKLKIGTIVHGVVSNVVQFGAFVNVNGVDGLIHISELSWQRVSHPSEVLQVGQEIDVHILDVDLKRERLSLSLKRLTSDPWEEIAEEYEEGQLVEVEVVNLAPFGAFAALLDKPGVEGLIHISELSEENVQQPEDVVQLNERYTAKIISLRCDERRVAFSLKQAMDNTPPTTSDIHADTDAEAAQQEAEQLRELSE